MTDEFASPTRDARADEIRALCRDYAEEMVEVLREIALDPGEKGAPRVAAATKLLEHGIGAPARKVEKTVDVTLHDHRNAQLAAFRRLADRRAKEQLSIPAYDRTAEDVEYTEVKSER